MVSGACRKRIAMSMANVPKPTSRIPPSELLVKSSTKVRRARGLCLIDSGTKIQVKNTTNDLKGSEIELISLVSLKKVRFVGF